ncbi:MAG: leucine-rich repeat domain-containing protein [Treponema sp.]|jgi:hypothetical protein|nr:leucine-rich repeat domain-containing protein [Treponema sp.]
MQPVDGVTLGANIFYNYIANDRKAGAYTSNMKAERKTADDFVYIETQYGLVITGYNQNAKADLRIPEQINGAAVKAIYGSVENRWLNPWLEGGAFQEKGITRLLILDGVTSIGDGAFSDNQLTSVVIPDSVTSIGTAAFSGNQLTSIVIPDGVIYIGAGAFDSNQLTSVVIPDSVTSIGYLAFDGNQLTSVTLGADIEVGSSAFGDSGFVDFYAGNDRKAGKYTSSNGKWSFTAR